MSNPEQDQDEGRRKSKRQRVPNAYYTAGINQLKKITLKAQSKKNRTDEEDDYSSEEERNISNNPKSYHQNHNGHDKVTTNNKWLPCIMPHTNRPIKVQIVLDSNQLPLLQPVKQKEQQALKQSLYISQPQNVNLPTFNSGQMAKKAEPQGALNLLSLFQKVIKNVSDQVPSPVKYPSHRQSGFGSSNMDQLGLKHQISTQKPGKVPVFVPPPKKVLEEDRDGKILSLTIDKQNKSLNIKHSKLGECKVPIEIDPPQWLRQTKLEEQDAQMIDEFRKKLQFNQALVKSIALYN